MPNQAYRLTIIHPSDSLQNIVITSVRGGTNPYIAAPPNGDGQEVDLLTGAVRTGAYNVEVVDVATGTDGTGTVRFITNKLYDSSGTTAQPHLLSREAKIELSTDGGATFPTIWQYGYLTGIEQVDAMRYVFTISDTRRVESTYQAFTWGSDAERTAFPQRGCLFGGPIIGGFGANPSGSGRMGIDNGGFEYSFLAKQGDVLSLSLLSAYGPPPKFEKTNYFPISAWDNIRDFLQYAPQDSSLTGANFNGINDRPNIMSYPMVTVIIENAAGTRWTGYIRGLGTGKFNPDAAFGEQTYDETQRRMFVQLYPGYPTWTPTAGTKVRVRGIQAEVSEQSPIYFDLHPVEVVTKLYTCAGIAFNAASATTVTNAIGPTTRLAARITEPQTLSSFLTSAIFGPFGFASRTNSAGEQEFFMTRYRSSTAPSVTINTSDLAGDEPPPVWSLAEDTVVTGFTISQQTFSTFIKVQGSTETPPSDGIRVGKEVVPYVNADTSTFSTRIVTYDIPGMVHDVSSFTPNLQALGLSIVREGFDRFGRGAASTELVVLRTSAAASAEVGDEVFVNAAHYPNRNYRIGESSVGARIAQIVRREERPDSIAFKLVDSGSNAQPATAATVSIAASAIDVRRIAQFTITNAATLNTGDIAVAVEYAVSSTTPTTNGVSFIRYEGGAVPTGAVQLPAVLPGSRVWVRVRSEKSTLRPSAWSAWTSVTLTAWAAPTSVSTSNITNESVQVSWNLNGNTLDDVDVFVAPGSVAPSDWRAFRINTLPNQSTSVVVRELTASTAYIVGVAFRDRVNNAFGTVTTATFTTAASTTTPTARPAGIQVIPGINDASLTQGIALALYSADESAAIVVERATVSGGPFTELAVLAPGTTSYVDVLPRTATTYYYRIRHRISGQLDSDPTPQVSGVSLGIGTTVAPDSVAPIVTVTTSESGTTATVTIDVDDPQNRLVSVEFRERTNNGAWSAWTVDSTAPYTDSATIPASGFVEIAYRVQGYTANGSLVYLASAVEAFDADTIANIVSASGTFSLAGALTLGIQADTDTASFKYITATTDWASDAAALSAATTSGALVNARNVTAILTGPYAVGTTVYLAIAGYTGASGGGTVSGPYRYSFLNGSRDTIPLIARARLFSVSATEAVVRVAVASPIALSPNTATIAYSVTGLSGVTPVTGQTVTPVTGDNVDETSATSYKDFTIPRPAANAVPGRITFTVTATGRVAATPSATIVAQDIVAPSLKIVTTPAANDYSLVVTWDGTIVYDLDGVSQSVSGWTSPRTVTITRNDFLGATKVAAFAVTKNSITASQSVNVPPKDNAGASITIGTQTADDVTDDYEFSWTTSGFPTGTTYNLTYTTTTTAGVIEQGSLTNQTSPVTVASGFNIGASPTYQMRIDAIKSGTLVLTASRSGTFLT